MAQFSIVFDVDLQRPVSPQPLKQMVCEGDSNGLSVGVRVYSDGEAVALGGECVGKVVRADGATVQLTGTINGNLASVVLDQTSCAIEGPIQVAICWVSGSNITTLVIAYGTVVNTQTGNAIEPSTPIPDLTQLLAEIAAMRAATDAANAAASKAVRYDTAQELTDNQKRTARANITTPLQTEIAPTWELMNDGDAGYIVGDYVFYSPTGRLYRCMRAHTPTSSNNILPTNNTYWRQYSVADDLSSVRQAFGQRMSLCSSGHPAVKYKLKNTFYTNWSKYYFTNSGSFTSHSGRSCVVIPATDFLSVFYLYNVDFQAGTTVNTSANPKQNYLTVLWFTDYPRVSGSIGGGGGNAAQVSKYQRLQDGTISIGRASIPATAKYIVINFPKEYEDIIEFNTYDFDYQTIQNNKSAVAQLVPNTGSEELYEPYRENVLAQMAVVKTKLETVSPNSLYFGFITDVHWTSNIRHTYKSLNYLYYNAGLRNVFFGGDTINGSDNPTLQYGFIKEQMRLFTEVYRDHFYTMIGNHEDNHEGGSGGIDNKMLYSAMFRHLEPQMQTTKFYYFIDNQTQKTRFFVLNTGFDSVIDVEQMIWFAQRLGEVPSGWDVIVFGHWFYNMEIPADQTDHFSYSGQIVRGLLGALKTKGTYTYAGNTYNYANTNNNVICMICGHTHADVEETTDFGFPIFITTCDKIVGGTPTYTVEDGAFDVFIIDKDAREIYAIRFGRVTEGKQSTRTKAYT